MNPLVALQALMAISGIAKMIDRMAERNRARKQGQLEERAASQERELEMRDAQAQIAADLHSKLNDPVERAKWLRDQAARSEPD